MSTNTHRHWLASFPQMALSGLALSLLGVVACGTTPGAPSEAEVVLHPSTASFTTSLGWTVTLDEAVLVPGALYVLAPEGDTTASLERSLSRVLLPVAYAHGGVDAYAGRPVRLEWLGPSSLSLLGAADVSLGVADGSVGTSEIATLEFEALSGDDATSSSPGHGQHVWVSGTATDGTTTLAFEGGMTFETTGTENLVETIPIAASVEAEGTLGLTVDVATWLDRVAFDRLADTSSPRTWTASSQAGIALDLGVRTPSAYALTYAATVAD